MLVGMNRFFFSLMLVMSLASCDDDKIEPIQLSFIRYYIDGIEDYAYRGASLNPEIRIEFSSPVDISTASSAITLYGKSGPVAIEILSQKGDSALVIKPISNLEYFSKYDFVLQNTLKGKNKQPLNTSVQASFTTIIDPKDKFTRISDEELLTLIQKQTFRYFWDFAHPVSGLIRERNGSGDLVTTGGSGFGVMCILVGIERGFITRQQGIERIQKISDFLKDKTDRFHGVFPHWLNGATGKTIAFSTKDDGGDLVETSFLIAGLLSASEYFDRNTVDETRLRQTIKLIWETVEWNWHTKNGETILYWHWSPKYNWEMNHKIQGWNEALITYVLAAASPTFPISKDVYEEGWARNGAMKNGKSFYGFPLALGEDLGGPLFFSHYSFLGIDPRNLKDPYAHYFEQCRNHSKINHAYCTANPKKYFGYSAECWGLTASDNSSGYSAHSPTNDLGVITPTAALSSFPFTPDESKQALKFFYYKIGDKIFKEHGFVDAFNLNNLWFANSYLAIDQGPIIIMIENYRTQLLWKTTMKNTDIQKGLQKLGFVF
jgi:hypothetical protein